VVSIHERHGVWWWYDITFGSFDSTSTSAFDWLYLLPDFLDGFVGTGGGSDVAEVGVSVDDVALADVVFDVVAEAMETSREVVAKLAVVLGESTAVFNC